jgi:hypothetical protein
MMPSKNQVTVVCLLPGKIVACATEPLRVSRHSTVGSVESVTVQFSYDGRYRNDVIVWMPGADES